MLPHFHLLASFIVEKLKFLPCPVHSYSQYITAEKKYADGVSDSCIRRRSQLGSERYSD